MLRIEDLAQIAAMSVSSFHRHFRAVIPRSPPSPPTSPNTRRTTAMISSDRSGRDFAVARAIATPPIMAAQMVNARAVVSPEHRRFQHRLNCPLAQPRSSRVTSQ
jgi:AraC-like DNA-binding protein